MTKKIVLVLCLCILAITCAFAGKASLVAQVSPYSLQIVSVEGGTYVSTYGYGAEGGFRYDINSNISAGVDLSLDFFKYKELKSDYIVVGIKAVGGYKYDFSDKFFAKGELGLGIDYRKIGNQAKPYFGMDAFLGCGYVLTEEVKVTGGLDLGLAFQKGESVKSTDFMVKTKIGAVMAL